MPGYQTAPALFVFEIGFLRPEITLGVSRKTRYLRPPRLQINSYPHKPGRGLKSQTRSTGLKKQFKVVPAQYRRLDVARALFYLTSYYRPCLVEKDNLNPVELQAKKSDLVVGKYTLFTPAGRKAPLKITDMLGEEVLVVEG